uniref:Domain of unknown function DB domain-containing protein n=1 Tax=Ascaris lumbricoides TaxID=6252 RepID=A0A0M3I0U7_ASCLU
MLALVSVLPALLLTCFLLLLLILAKVSAEPDKCQKLAVCALDKCISEISTFPPKDELVEHLLGKTNFACLLGPTCFDRCNECASCKYAQKQIQNAVLKVKLDGECPLLEKCAQSCLDDHATDPFSCIFSRRCAKYCLDNEDCPQCFDIVKRVFTGYCYRNGFIEHYGRKCRPMFDEITKAFVRKAR